MAAGRQTQVRTRQLNTTLKLASRYAHSWKTKSSSCCRLQTQTATISHLISRSSRTYSHHPLPAAAQPPAPPTTTAAHGPAAASLSDPPSLPRRVVVRISSQRVVKKGVARLKNCCRVAAPHMLRQSALPPQAGRRACRLHMRRPPTPPHDRARNAERFRAEIKPRALALATRRNTSCQT